MPSVDIRTLSRPEPGIYRGPVLCRLAGISYRQMDYWARTGILRPSVAEAQGSGSQRLYSSGDLLLARAIHRLLDLGLSLHRIRDLVDPFPPGEVMGLREAIRRGRKRWTTAPQGGAGIWLDLEELRRWLDDVETRFEPPAA